MPSPLSLFLLLVLFSLAGSLFSRLTGLDPGLIAPTTSILTLAAGIAAAFPPPRPWPPLVVALLLGAGAEIVGLATGFPFGRYVYTTAWWPTVTLPGIGPFPLALPFAWLMMAGAARRSLPWGTGRSQTAALALAGGFLAALVDLAMEPVLAGPLHYWRWLAPGPLPGGAPVTNFLGWWATATLAGLVLTTGTKPARSTVPRWVLGGFVALIVGLGAIDMVGAPG